MELSPLCECYVLCVIIINMCHVLVCDMYRNANITVSCTSLLFHSGLVVFCSILNTLKLAINIFLNYYYVEVTAAVCC